MQNQHELLLLEKCEKLEKELVLKNRELEIEAALERIRSRSMAMHKSDELMEVIQLVYEQLVRLGLKIDSTNFCLNYKESDDFAFWTAISGSPYPTEFYIPYFDHPWFIRFKEAKRKGLQFTADSYSFEEKNTFYSHFFNHAPAVTEERKKYILSCPGLTMSQVYMNTISLLITNYEGIPFSDEENEVFMRIGNVFEQAYTRFLDLQKAEAQAREAKIQLSLERIRAKAMAMQHSEELSDFLTVVFEQYEILNLNPVICHLSFLDIDNNRSTFRTTGKKGATLIATQEIDFDASPFWKQKVEDYKAGKPDEVDVMHIPYESLPELFEIFKEIRSKLPEYALPQQVDFPNGQYVIEGYCKYGYIGYSASRPPSDEEKEITRRIANEFGNVYQRFFDLQKAEAQAREAQIQLSLERIRAKAMAMQHSDELSGFLTVLFEQFSVLNLNPVNSQLSLFDVENKRSNFRLTGKNGATVIASQDIDMDASPVWKQMIEDWKAGHPNDVDLIYIPFESLPQMFEIFKEILSKIPEDDLPLLEDYPNGQYVVLGYCKYGYLGYTASRPPSDEEKEITRRIANEFGNVYQRFLDLQKAESQAREAQIENALEKVRSRTMAMQHSDELTDVAGLLFNQVSALGIKTWTAGFNVWSEDNNSYVDYLSLNGEIYGPNTVHIEKAEALKDLSNARKSGVEFDILYVEGEKIKELYLAISGIDEKEYDIMVKDGLLPSQQYEHFVFGTKVSVMFITYEPVPEAHDIFKRLGKVFEQTYTRFLDLQKAEAQAREAIKRASVDRVRAEIASMRTKGDLERIQPLIWNELKILRVPFIRCGVFIMDEVKQDVQVFLSTPDGKSIAAFRLPYYATEQSKQIVTHWQKKQLYKDHMDEAAFTAYTKNLVQQGAMAGNEKYVTENRPTDLYLHFLPFLQGMLYVGNEVPLKEEELQLVQNLADAFSTAYARYEDFNKLELAKAEVESAMTELKATQSQLVQQEKLASLGQLTAGIAHEIKNPLNFVNNFSEVSIELIEEALEEITKVKTQHAASPVEQDVSLKEVIAIMHNVQSNLRKVYEHGTRANTIVTSMLQHSRGGSGKKEPTDLNALIKEYVNLSFHGMRAGKNPINVDIVLDLDPEVKEVSLINEDFTRVIINLCNNAFDALKTVKTQRPASLRVRTKKHLDTITIEIEDNGPGIPDDIKDKILQPFFTTKKGTEGTGLGLSITHDIVKAHGGELTLASNEKVGTQFTVKIPIA